MIVFVRLLISQKSVEDCCLIQHLNISMGVYLSQPNLEKEINHGAHGKVKFTSAEMQGWRKNMEDAKIALPKVEVDTKIYSIFGVFDGHGGTEVSKFVEAHFVEELLKNDSFKKGNVAAALEQNFRKMDDMLLTPEGTKELNEIRRKFQGEDMDNERIGSHAGCTANVVVFDDDHYYIANSGDSRSALCRAGKLVTLSEDHKPESEIEKNRIEKAGGMIMNGRVNGGLNLTRAIGDFQYKGNSSLNYKDQMITCHPDVKKVPRQASDDFIIMGCDGICQQMIDYLVDRRKNETNTVKLMKELLDGLVAKNTVEEVGCDNMTAILIQFQK